MPRRGGARAGMLGVALAICASAAPAHEFELALALETLDYEEPGLMEENGLLFGVDARWRALPARGWGGELATSLLVGGTDYDGRTVGTGLPVSTDTEDLLWSAAARLGYALGGARPFLYGGIGRRYWRQEIKGAGGYRRAIEWWYLPLGAHISGTLDGRNWHWSAGAEYRWLLDGEVVSHLGDAQPAFSDVENDVDSGRGFELALSLRRRHIVVTPYYQYWDVERSDLQPLVADGIPVGAVYEPANTTRSFGVRLGWLF